MELQAFVNVSTDFSQNTIQISGITKIIYSPENIMIWALDESSSAARFLNHNNNEKHFGATYVIPVTLIGQLHMEGAFRLLPPGKTEEVIQVAESHREEAIHSDIKDFLLPYIKSEDITPRMNAFILKGAAYVKANTLAELFKKATVTRLKEVEAIGDGVIKAIKAIGKEHGLTLRN
ncbi:hypothetical protein SAMN05428988_3164 [Chitinophaga sp. YR573]|uniref:hypothetical protein n=1 Tax=Chitinophaga sp. YR573 TaxID=1881040 RepID=UPI0008AD8CDA|nr:hypothetical protein [Chitinophaga sp. YR573]SEW21036.1 hypothetical protein SAMN05428988_3164 [Chitinophaga sp. YR573]